MSLTFAAVVMTGSGVPRPSQIKWCLLPDLPLPAGELFAQVSQGAAGQDYRRWVDEHTKLLADTDDLGRRDRLPGASLRRRVQLAVSDAS